MTGQLRNFKSGLDNIAGRMGSNMKARTIQEIVPFSEQTQRQIKLKTLKAIQGVCDDVIKGMGQISEKLDDLDQKLTGTVHRGVQLENKTKEELYSQAKELDIEGRSTMTKKELVAAIRKQW